MASVSSQQPTSACKQYYKREREEQKKPLEQRNHDELERLSTACLKESASEFLDKILNNNKH